MLKNFFCLNVNKTFEKRKEFSEITKQATLSFFLSLYIYFFFFFFLSVIHLSLQIEKSDKLIEKLVGQLSDAREKLKDIRKNRVLGRDVQLMDMDDDNALFNNRFIFIFVLFIKLSQDRGKKRESL